MTVRGICYAILAGFGGAVAIILMVLSTGATFGQRCNRAFPDDPVAAERCVYDLSHGERP
jgi:hypothetical protein